MVFATGDAAPITQIRNVDSALGASELMSTIPSSCIGRVRTVFPECNVDWQFAFQFCLCCIFDEYDDALVQGELAYRLQNLRCRMADRILTRRLVGVLGRVFRLWGSVMKFL